MAGYRPEQVQQAAGGRGFGQAFVVEGDLTQQVQLAFGAGHGHVEQALRFVQTTRLLKRFEQLVFEGAGGIGQVAWGVAGHHKALLAVVAEHFVPQQ